MLAAPYMNDNPFRLLGLRSSTPQAELQKAADLADQTAQIGIPPASGLMQVFGAEMLPTCSAKVQSLQSDPVERSVYRLFWPFDYQPTPRFKGTLGDLLQFDEIGSASSFRILHLRFVIAWIKYLVQPCPPNVQEVLNAFANLSKEEELYRYLVDLLIQDGETSDQAQQVGNHAPAIVLDRMVMVFRRQAVQWWETGDITAATGLVQTLSEAGFDDEMTAKILADLVECGEQESTRLQGVVQSYQAWTLNQPLPDPTEVAKLRLVALAMQRRVPAAQRWLQVVDDRVRQVAGAMRDQALHLATDQGQYEAAGRILAHIQLFPLPEDLARPIRDADAQLQATLKAQQEEIWKGITPISSGPSMATINGVGTKVYGRTPFAGDPDWYFTTYYFVVLFIPVFPIRRYLVKDAPGRGWYFRASAPLTTAHKYHLGVSLALIALFLVFGALGSAHPTASQGGYSPPLPGAQSGYANSGSGGTNTLDDSENPKKKQLRAERDALDAELTRLDAGLDQRKKELDSIAEKLHTDGKKVNEHSRSAVNAYNARLDAFDKSRKKFEADVADYNKKVKRMNNIVEQIRK